MNDLFLKILSILFSGLGVFILGLFIYRKHKDNYQKQKITKESRGYQAGGDINIVNSGESNNERNSNSKN